MVFLSPLLNLQQKHLFVSAFESHGRKKKKRATTKDSFRVELLNFSKTNSDSERYKSFTELLKPDWIAVCLEEKVCDYVSEHLTDVACLSSYLLFGAIFQRLMFYDTYKKTNSN